MARLVLLNDSPSSLFITIIITIIIVPSVFVSSLKPQAFSCNRVVAYHASFRASHAYLVSGVRGNSSKGCHLYPSGARGIPSDLHSREPGRIEPTLLQGESGLIDLFSRRHGNGLWPGTIQLLSIIGSIGLWPGFKDLSAFGHGA